MGRWAADAAGRLQEAAMALYAERGYEDVTVAEIAERAGLTKRTFFRHYADKREVFFAGARDFETAVLAGVEANAASTTPIDAVVGGFRAGAAVLAGYGDFPSRRRVLIASSADLRERELTKNAVLTGHIAATLERHGVQSRRAGLAAHAGVVVFTAAFDRWAADGAAGDLPALVGRVLHELREVLDGG